MVIVLKGCHLSSEKFLVESADFRVNFYSILNIIYHWRRPEIFLFRLIIWNGYYVNIFHFWRRDNLHLANAKLFSVCIAFHFVNYFNVSKHFSLLRISQQNILTSLICKSLSRSISIQNLYLLILKFCNYNP